MLTDICRELKNWFVKSDDDKKIGVFTISNGVITPSLDLHQDQYYRIIGSLYNDGVHKYQDSTDVLRDEEFDGAIWLMHIPDQVLKMEVEVSDFISKYGNASPYTSESFGGYSYTKSEGSNDWRKVFSGKLNNWRKIL